MINDILGLIFLGTIVSLALSNGFNITKMERSARKLAIQALSDARKMPLPTLKGIPSPNPYGCGTFECHIQSLRNIKKNR